MYKKIEDSETMTFTYQGGYDVDALTVARTIESLVEMTTEIARERYPEAQVNLSVRGSEKGSLDIIFATLAQYSSTIFTPDNIAMAKDTVQGIVGVFQIKQFLKGSKPQKVTKCKDTITITDNTGNTIEVSASSNVFFINGNMDVAANRIFDAASDSVAVSGISIRGENVEGIEIPRGEFESCSAPVDIEQDETEHTVLRQNETLHIRKPDLMGDSQWGFVSDKYILADVKDGKFLDKIKQGDISICSKTYIVADVLVKIPYINGIPDDKKCKYTVTEVHSVHSPDENQIEI